MNTSVGEDTRDIGYFAAFGEAGMEIIILAPWKVGTVAVLTQGRSSSHEGGITQATPKEELGPNLARCGGLVFYLLEQPSGGVHATNPTADLNDSGMPVQKAI